MFSVPYKGIYFNGKWKKSGTFILVEIDSHFGILHVEFYISNSPF
jgi:hypothetical protein